MPGLTDGHALCSLWSLHCGPRDAQLHCILMLELILDEEAGLVNQYLLSYS